MLKPLTDEWVQRQQEQSEHTRVSLFFEMRGCHCPRAVHVYVSVAMVHPGPILPYLSSILGLYQNIPGLKSKWTFLRNFHIQINFSPEAVSESCQTSSQSSSPGRLGCRTSGCFLGRRIGALVSYIFWSWLSYNMYLCWIYHAMHKYVTLGWNTIREDFKKKLQRKWHFSVRSPTLRT